MSAVYVSWSFDDGYENIKLYNGFSEPFVVPCFYTDEWFPFKKHDFQTTIDPMEHITVVYQGKKYLVGKGAQEHADVDWNVDDNKHLDETGFYVSYHLALALASQDHPEDELRVFPLTMGLPVKFEEIPDRHKQIKKLAKGTQDIHVEFADGTVVKKTIHVEEVVIKKQPWGSFCHLLMDEDGNLVNKELKEIQTVVSDIGAKTHNILTLDKTAPKPNYSDQTENGVFSFYSRIAAHIENKTGVKVPGGQLPLIVQEGKIGKLDLTEVINHEKKELAVRILNDLSKTLGSYKAYITKVIFTGGGAVFVRKELEELVKSFFPLLNPKTDVVFLDQRANAIGLRKYGVLVALSEGKEIIQPEKTA
jgi:plasmid segregation protein ParM